MNLRPLSNPELLDRLTKLVRTERKITHLILESIAEIDRRQLYLERAFPSLFEFLTKEFGYSASAAQRRIDGARLLRQIPELAPKIESGKITLSQISYVVQTVRAQKTPVPLAAKLDLLKQVEEKTFAETKEIVAQTLNTPPPRFEKTQPHADGSVTITLTFTKEQFRMWEEARALCSHAVPTGKHSDLAGHLAEKEVERRLEIRRASGKRHSKNPRQIVPQIRKEKIAEALQTQKGCEYRDPQSGRRCGTRFFLQIDHVKPVWAGGGRDAENLQVLCSNHNRWKYRRETGTRRASPVTEQH